MGRGDTYDEDVLGTDTVEIQMQFEGGHCLSIGVCWGLPEGTPEHWHEVCHGPLGLVYPERIGGGVFDPADKSGMARMVVNDAFGEHRIDCKADPAGPEICINDLAAAIKVDAANEFDGQAGREALRLILATLESISTGQTVFLNS